MPRNTYRNTRVVLALLFASLLVTSRDLLSPSILPQEALVWTAFAGLAYLALVPLSWRRLGWAFVAAGAMAALNVAVTSFNPVDPITSRTGTVLWNPCWSSSKATPCRCH